ncbi:tripartite tricarboxylate transporter substrate binding protein [Metabacillus endolithicus]|uniref:Tripartite tricarboxylate transporter substrate binding protein n=1 Tax=Metabacillus endolithicus TaxID=1535204 RepID=A0ABW5C0X8_9BACI|nr:tripartite tricarboxylate transporter substrate binding protein [Metabacillus endolithicus]UPG62521.1 tripartite tricarboxylate transporter substrate binding protein [Metabacillus endolithicus]
MARRNVLKLFIISLVISLIVGCSGNSQTGSNSTESGTDKSNSGSKNVEYPTKKISLILPNSPGGGGDIFYRAFAKVAEKYIDQPIVIENKTGGSGSLAINEMMNRDADGYTILGISQTEAYAFAHGVIPNKMEDIQPISSIAAGRDALFTLEKSFKTYDEFKTFGIENPGEMKIVSVGTFNDNHVSGMTILQEAGIDGQYIPYDNPGLADKAILSGDAHVAVASVSAVASLVQEGSHTLLAVGGNEGLELFPNVPTFKELGLDIEGFDYRGFAVKPGTPQEVIDQFNDLVSKVIKDPEWQEYLSNSGQEDYFNQGSEFEAIFKESYENGKAMFEIFEN